MSNGSLTDGAEPAAAFVGVGGRASVALRTWTHTAEPTVKEGQGTEGFSL